MQKNWLRETSNSLILQENSQEVYEYLKMLSESNDTDIQTRMLIRTCSENLNKQYPNQFSFDFLSRAQTENLSQLKLNKAFLKESSAAGQQLNEPQPINDTNQVCNSCNNKISTFAKFCPTCGEKTLGPSVSDSYTAELCSHCGCRLKQNDLFCPGCGLIKDIKPAGLVKRFLSVFIDLIVLFFYSSAVVFLLQIVLMVLIIGSPSFRAISFGFSWIQRMIFAYSIIFLISGSYYVLLENFIGIGSVGKKLLSLKLISLKEKSLSFKSILLRHLGRCLEFSFVMGYLFRFWYLPYDFSPACTIYPHEIKWLASLFFYIFFLFVFKGLYQTKTFPHDKISSTTVIDLNRRNKLS